LLQLKTTAPRTAKEERAFKSDAALALIQNMTPDEVETWIEANVNNIADVKRVLKMMAKAIVLFARRL
jgi:phosphoenolpyruvate-protein kinase (PTS system EI component)